MSELSEAAIKQAEEYLAEFAKNLKLIADKAISDVYTELVPYIEGDVWSNYRYDLIEELCDYHKFAKFTLDSKRIRKKMLEENYEQIVKDLNADLLKEIEDLKETIKTMQRYR